MEMKTQYTNKMGCGKTKEVLRGLFIAQYINQKRIIKFRS